MVWIEKNYRIQVIPSDKALYVTAWTGITMSELYNSCASLWATPLLMDADWPWETEEEGEYKIIKYALKPTWKLFVLWEENHEASEVQE